MKRKKKARHQARRKGRERERMRIEACEGMLLNMPVTERIEI
jgi:hypothetical protein